MKKLSMILVLLALALTACSAPKQKTAEFIKADTNQDSKISLAEWDRYGGGEASYLAVDPERKGALDEAKFRQAVRLNDEATGGGGERQRKVLDSQIASDVKSSLGQSRELNAWNINVEVYQGNVTLSGPVRSSKEKLMAEQMASRVMGVNSVFNQLVIKQ